MQNVDTRSAPQIVTPTNSQGGNLIISRIQTQGDFAETNDCPRVRPVGVSCTINMTFAPTAGEIGKAPLSLLTAELAAPKRGALGNRQKRNDSSGTVTPKALKSL